MPVSAGRCPRRKPFAYLMRSHPGATVRLTTLQPMGGRLATDDEVKAWQADGWVLLEG